MDGVNSPYRIQSLKKKVLVKNDMLIKEVIESITLNKIKWRKRIQVVCRVFIADPSQNILNQAFIVVVIKSCQ